MASNNEFSGCVQCENFSMWKNQSDLRHEKVLIVSEKLSFHLRIMPFGTKKNLGKLAILLYPTDFCDLPCSIKYRFDIIHPSDSSLWIETKWYQACDSELCSKESNVGIANLCEVNYLEQNGYIINDELHINVFIQHISCV